MLKKIINSDRNRYRIGESQSWMMCYLLHPGFCFTVWYRLAAHCREHRYPRIISKFLTWMVLRQSLKTGIQINPGAEVGEGLYMPHYGGIVVNPEAVIGKNCYLSHNVLIGKVHTGKRKGVPVIGDDVFIGTGAVVLGNLTVGDNAAIGANSVVIDHVPENAFVAGSPARVIHYKGAQSLLDAENNSVEN